VFEHSIWIFVKEHLVDCHVERRYHFLRVSYQLTVQIRIELTEVLTIEVEERLANYTYLCKLNTRVIFTHQENHPYLLLPYAIHTQAPCGANRTVCERS